MPVEVGEVREGTEEMTTAVEREASRTTLFNLKGIKGKVHEKCQSLPKQCGGQTRHHFDLGVSKKF